MSIPIVCITIKSNGERIQRWVYASATGYLNSSSSPLTPQAPSAMVMAAPVKA